MSAALKMTHALNTQSRWCHAGIMPSNAGEGTILPTRKASCSILSPQCLQLERPLLAYSHVKRLSPPAALVGTAAAAPLAPLAPAPLHCALSAFASSGRKSSMPAMSDALMCGSRCSRHFLWYHIVMSPS